MHREVSDHLFSFAVIADTHVNEADRQCNSPFAVNRLANQRLGMVVDDINRRNLVAVFHLGDAVHPVPSTGRLYTDSVSRFFAQADRLRHPLHIIPGNHDVGDKKIGWGPTATVRDGFLDAWTENFGKHYFHVSHEGMVFIGINAQVIGSGLDMEREQRQWLESLLPTLSGKRLVLLSHYPPFLEHETEPEHYDNLSLEGRQWLLGLVRKHRFEALFCGHVHNFWYYRYSGCDCYLLPSTAFVRQDYSELFKMMPLPDQEYGRNDMPKLGYLIVHVYRTGHDFEMVRCIGPQEQESDAGGRPLQRCIQPVNPRTNRHPLIGFDLRHDWMEQISIPSTGALEEFGRKQVRNDYPMLALWEMGVRDLRVPLDDFLDHRRRARMRDLQHIGFIFSTYSFGVPDKVYLDAMEDCAQMISAMEIIWPVNEIESLDVRAMKALSGVRMVYSPLWQSRNTSAGKVYYHVINHGMTDSDLNQGSVRDILARLPDIFSGCVFRLGADGNVEDTIRQVTECDAQNGTESIVHLRLAGENPAAPSRGPSFASERIARAMLSSWLLDGPIICCDTLIDHDRGYFPRDGVLDRLCNPRPAFGVVRNLHGLLDRLDNRVWRMDEESEGRHLQIRTDDHALLLHYSQISRELDSAEAAINLLTGEVFSDIGKIIDV